MKRGNGLVSLPRTTNLQVIVTEHITRSIFQAHGANGRQPERQTDRQTDRQTGQTDRQTDRQTDGRTDGRTDGPIATHQPSHRQTNKQADTKTDRPKSRQTNHLSTLWKRSFTCFKLLLLSFRYGC